MALIICQVSATRFARRVRLCRGARRLGKALQGLAGGTAGGDRDRLVENWLRVARIARTA